MSNTVVVVGLGEMGSVFARSFLRSGLCVVPVTRQMKQAQVAQEYPDPIAVLIAVAESDLHTTLQAVPTRWKDRVILLQNELLPADWQGYGFTHPTVISVWFEKKKGQDSKVLIPSPAYGPHAALLQTALGTLDIPVRLLSNPDELLHELILKNVYILTTNISGLECGGTVKDLWQDHRDLATTVAHEVMDLQAAMTGVPLDRDQLIAGMVEAFAGDWQHQCMGRSAPARLQRALDSAAEYELTLPKLGRIANAQGKAEIA